MEDPFGGLVLHSVSWLLLLPLLLLAAALLLPVASGCLLVRWDVCCSPAAYHMVHGTWHCVLRCALGFGFCGMHLIALAAGRSTCGGYHPRSFNHGGSSGACVLSRSSPVTMSGHWDSL